MELRTIDASILPFWTGGWQCGLPVAAVERAIPALEIDDLPGAPAIVRGVFNLAGAVLPLVDLQRGLAGAEADLRPDARFVIFASRLRRMAVLADRVEPARQMQTEALGELAEILPGLARMAGLGAGERMLYLFDPDALLAAAEEADLAAALARLS